MRERQEVVDKFHELRERYLRERKEKFLCHSPENCFFNFKQHVRSNGRVGFCQNAVVMKAVGVKVFVCNDEETSRRCRCFKCRNTVESVERDFSEIVGSPAKCGQEYPKLAMLIWFLQDFGTERSRRGVFSKIRSIFRGLSRWT